MTHNQVVTIARSIELNEIITDGSFEHNHVVDLRNNENGCARPVEENVLNRLKNHFISYDQLAMDLKDSGPCEEIHLCEMLKEYEGNVLLITEDVPQAAHLCSIYKIPFNSKVFYVVETGKGDVIKPFTPVEDRQPERLGSLGA